MLLWLDECLTSFLPVQHHRTTRSASTCKFWCNNPRQDQGWVTKKSVGYVQQRNIGTKCRTKSCVKYTIVPLALVTVSNLHTIRHFLSVPLIPVSDSYFDTPQSSSLYIQPQFGEKGWLILRLQISYILGCYAGYNKREYSAGLIA